ncbi:MAG: conjugal transfer protein TraX [Lachnospiraceae bacterium]|nr:conjugal transfer protein TraX [Lachnospiraceae bacterium]
MSAKTIRLRFNMRRIAGFTGNQLKLIALLFMLCDHIGFMLIENGVLYGQNPVYWSMAVATPEGQRWYLAARILRTLGRLSFPIFAFMTAEGAVHTGNAKKYLTRLFLFAAISEVPFDLAIKNTWFYPEYQNVMFTLFLGALSITLMQKCRRLHIIFRLMIAGICCMMAYLIKSDYGAVGVFMISALYLVREDRNAMLITGAIIAAAESIEYACVSVLAFGIIYFYNGKRGELPMKYFFYIAYPAHLLMFWAMVYFANR